MTLILTHGSHKSTAEQGPQLPTLPNANTLPSFNAAAVMSPVSCSHVNTLMYTLNRALSLLRTRQAAPPLPLPRFRLIPSLKCPLKQIWTHCVNTLCHRTSTRPTNRPQLSGRPCWVKGCVTCQQVVGGCVTCWVSVSQTCPPCGQCREGSQVGSGSGSGPYRHDMTAAHRHRHIQNVQIHSPKVDSYTAKTLGMVHMVSAFCCKMMTLAGSIRHA
jgi:hypothetical protein